MQTKTSSDDLALIRLIAHTGTLAGAARRLGINHATAFRRLSKIESRLGARLFERGRDRYILTPAGELAADHARRIADELSEFENKVAGIDLAPSGTVRLATTDTLLAGVVGPVLTDFRRAPLIDLEVITSNVVADLSRREAELALRPSRSPPEFLLGRRVGKIELAIYATSEVANNNDPFAGRGASWIGPDESFGEQNFSAWFAANGLEQAVRTRTNTLMGMFALTVNGHGFSVLPTYLAEPVPALVRLSSPIQELTTDLWLLRHPALRHTVRIKALSDFLAQRITDGVL
ncbi:LysR family transcriptional regulator [Rhizobium etli]|uniref:LysR family transcriptional regulator n=1 Tax=Rhizobium etli TaxID=29449 RepID=UPI00038397A0|nr:LysR family transcriptional regulator [Rhizobium etli]AGS24531.1 LysR family transcriptional regulator protein [Rhizobium etli bv. mimosae str. Mim1]